MGFASDMWVRLDTTSLIRTLFDLHKHHIPVLPGGSSCTSVLDDPLAFYQPSSTDSRQVKLGYVGSSPEQALSIINFSRQRLNSFHADTGVDI